MPSCISAPSLWLPFVMVFWPMVTAALGSNLVCNGDFEDFVLTGPDSNKYQNLTSSKYNYISNNASCWYAQWKSFIEVKQFKVGSQLTQVADFISTLPYTICQDFILKSNQPYDLSFSFIIDGPHSNSTLICTVNSVSMYSIVSSSTVTPSYGHFRLVPTQTINKVCFSTVTVFKLGTPLFDTTAYGPALDNVTLIQVVTSSSNGTNNTISNDTTIHAIDIISNQNQFPVQAPNRNIIINIKTYWNPYSGILYLYTDCRIADYYISLEFLMHFIVEINQETQEKSSFQLDMDGYLFAEVEPNIVYASDYIDNLRVYVPQEILADTVFTNITFYVDGNQIKLNDLSASEQAVFNQAEPYIMQMTKTMKQAFAFLNMFYCSFFILGIIEFWNLTLLYNFLPIKGVPKFVQAFFSKMINFFFTFNSLTTEINRIANKTNPTQSLADFSDLTDNEKVLSVKSGHVWFAFSGMSSNFLVNNFDSLVLLSFFMVKCLLLKLLLRILKLKFANLSQVRSHLFLSQFSSELLCFAPFITISALSVFCYMGETNFIGKLNNFLHIFMVFCVIAIPCLPLVKALKKRCNKTHEKPKDRQEKVIKALLNLLIPVTVVINNSIGFFVVISLLLLWKFINFFVSFKTYSWFDKIIRIITNICWIVYHLCFMVFFGSDKIKGQSWLTEKVIKYMGFTAILCLLLGGLFDILKCLVDLLVSMIRLIIYLYHLCCADPKDQPKDVAIKNAKQNRPQVDQTIPVSGSKKQENSKIDSVLVNKSGSKQNESSSSNKNRNQHQQKNDNKSNLPQQKETRINQHRSHGKFPKEFIFVPVDKIDGANGIRIQDKSKWASKVKRVRKNICD